MEIAADQQLLPIVSATAPATIDDVIAVMQNIDTLLPGNEIRLAIRYLFIRIIVAPVPVAVLLPLAGMIEVALLVALVWYCRYARSSLPSQV